MVRTWPVLFPCLFFYIFLSFYFRSLSIYLIFSLTIHLLYLLLLLLLLSLIISFLSFLLHNYILLCFSVFLSFLLFFLDFLIYTVQLFYISALLGMYTLDIFVCVFYQTLPAGRESVANGMSRIANSIFPHIFFTHI